LFFPPNQSRAPHPSKTPEIPPRFMPNIIVLDNNKETRIAISNLLKSKGHHVHAVDRASDAIDLGHLLKPELLITDWKLEDEYDGFEVCEAFRFANSNVRLIMTADAESIDGEPRHDFLFRYFQKPIQPDDFLKAVDEALAE
jgi:CheY-like chemotaxis protein